MNMKENNSISLIFRWAFVIASFYILLANIFLIYDFDGFAFIKYSTALSLIRCNFVLLFILIAREIFYTRGVISLTNKKKYLLLAGVFIVYVILNLNSNDNYFRAIMYCSWWYVALLISYLLLDPDDMDKVFTFLYCIGIIACSFYLFQRLSLKSTAQLVNSVYYAVLALPIVFFPSKRKRGILEILFISIVLITTIISQKRTAMIIVFAIILLYYSHYKDNNQKGRTGLINKTLLVLVFVALIGITASFYLKENGTSAFMRILEMDISDNSRVEIYTKVLEGYRNNGFFEHIFGKGYNAVSFDFGYSAHNDFIEILYDFGLLGLIFYILAFLNLFKVTVGMIRNRHPFKNVLISSLIIWALMSFASHIVFVPTYFIELTIVWGITLKQLEEYKLSGDE